MSKIGRKIPAQAHFHTSNLSEHCSSKHDFFSIYSYHMKGWSFSFPYISTFFHKIIYAQFGNHFKSVTFFWDTRYRELSFFKKQWPETLPHRIIINPLRTIDFAATCISHRLQPEYTGDNMIMGYIVSWEPCRRALLHIKDIPFENQKGAIAYISKIFHWEPVVRYRHRLCTAIVPFWLSMEHASFDCNNTLLALNWRYVPSSTLVSLFCENFPEPTSNCHTDAITAMLTP